MNSKFSKPLNPQPHRLEASPLWVLAITSPGLVFSAGTCVATEAHGHVSVGNPGARDRGRMEEKHAQDFDMSP